MSSSGPHERDRLRQAYADAWDKHNRKTLLSAQEGLIVEVIGLHPEYQALVQDKDRALAFEPAALPGAENPFLHMGLHIAVREQLAIDRPPGVLELHGQLQRQSSDPHAAEHILMEALAETLWEAQRAGRVPDEQRYLALGRSRLKR